MASRRMLSMHSPASASLLCCLIVVQLMWVESLDDSFKHDGPLVSTVYESGFDISPGVCKEEGKDVRLVVVVHSEISHRDMRDSARFTWATFGGMRNVSIVFLLGRDRDNSVPNDVFCESDMYGDVIVSKNVDSFDNLTLKAVAMAEWVSSECPGARFVVKLDDDVFLNFPRLLQLLDQQQVSGGSRTLFGDMIRDNVPVRNRNDKYYISTKEYPGNKYPPYLRGGAFLFTGDLAKDQFSTALRTKFFRMQDLYFTAFLSDSVQAQLTHVEGFLAQKWWHGKKKDKSHVCDLKKKVAVYSANYENMFNMWGMIFDKKAKC